MKGASIKIHAVFLCENGGGLNSYYIIYIPHGEMQSRLARGEGVNPCPLNFIKHQFFQMVEKMSSSDKEHFQFVISGFRASGRSFNTVPRVDDRQIAPKKPSQVVVDTYLIDNMKSHK